MNDLTLLALALVVAVAVETIGIWWTRLAHRRSARRLRSVLEHLDAQHQLDLPHLTALLDRHHYWVDQTRTATDPNQRAALARLAQSELAEAAEILNRPEYAALGQASIEQIMAHDPDLRAHLVTAVNAQIRLDRWRRSSASDWPAGIAPRSQS